MALATMMSASATLCVRREVSVCIGLAARNVLCAAGLDGAAIRQTERYGVAEWPTVLGFVSLDVHRSADRKIGLLQALLRERIRRAEFDAPVRDAAILRLHVEIQPAMRIHP